MPMSNPWHLPAVLHFVQQLKIKSVLDVGVGLGTYGFMMRQFLDIACERLSKDEWQIRIDGIELYEPYRNPIWSYAYNNVIIDDIRNIIENIDIYDVIICNDVLEHFPKEEAQKLILQLLDHAPVIIATTPSSEWPQGAWGGNEAETHHCLLLPPDIPHLVLALKTGATNCYLIAKNIEHIDLINHINSGCNKIIDPFAFPEKRSIIFRVLRKIKAICKSVYLHP